jgi:hypothetical protein
MLAVLEEDEPLQRRKPQVTGFRKNTCCLRPVTLTHPGFTLSEKPLSATW